MISQTDDSVVQTTRQDTATKNIKYEGGIQRNFDVLRLRFTSVSYGQTYIGG